MKEIKDEIDEAIKKIKEELKNLDPSILFKIERFLKQFRNSLSVLYDAAIHDDKTGLYNSRFFKSIFEIEIDRAKREKDSLSLLIVDIDHFKKINDSYGHLFGDKILLILAKRMKQELRRYNVLARFGGEEFFILLPGDNIVKAKRTAERLRKSLWKNKTLKKYKITVSIGITEFKRMDTPGRMIKRADKALYVSKNKGRNRVCVL